MTRAERLAWLGGVFDGEGNVHFAWNKTSNVLQVALRVGMTSGDAILQVDEIWEDEGVTVGWHEVDLPSGKIAFYAQAVGFKNFRLAGNLLLPYLATCKRQEIASVLDGIDMIELHPLRTAERRAAHRAAYEVISESIPRRYAFPKIGQGGV